MDSEERKDRIGLTEEELNRNWHRHINPDGTPGGWVENTASVAPTAYVGPEAVVQGSSSVTDTSEIRDKAKVIDADVGSHSVLEGQAVAVGGEYQGEALRDEVVVRWSDRRSPTPHPRVHISLGSPRSR